MANLLRSVVRITAGALFAALFMLSGALSVSAQQVSTLEAPAAHEKALKGELVLVDIRTPEEWKATGVPASAHAITMHQDPQVFLAALLKATGGDADKPVAVICRTGSRSTALAGPLSKAGFPNVINVTEGVAGGPGGPGWKKRALPMRSWTKDDAGPQLAAQ
ncbi:MAG: rhodanese-like domain-containing protein [Alphaproteobacteria bacterium]|nr:rhodanese-like domain-containing protein [Alphaproteobacteria bacterium]